MTQKLTLGLAETELVAARAFAAKMLSSCPADATRSEMIGVVLGSLISAKDRNISFEDVIALAGDAYGRGAQVIHVIE